MTAPRPPPATRTRGHDPCTVVTTPEVAAAPAPARRRVRPQSGTVAFLSTGPGLSLPPPDRHASAGPDARCVRSLEQSASVVLDQAELVPFGIGHHDDHALVDVVDRDVQVQAYLAGLRLGHGLEDEEPMVTPTQRFVILPAPFLCRTACSGMGHHIGPDDTPVGRPESPERPQSISAATAGLHRSGYRAPRQIPHETSQQPLRLHEFNLSTCAR